MEITRVKIHTATVKADFHACADTFDSCFRVVGLRLVVGPNGYELFMPTKKMPRGERLPVTYPLTDEMKNRIEAAVIAEYERVSGEKLSSHT